MKLKIVSEVQREGVWEEEAKQNTGKRKNVGESKLESIPNTSV